jgi:hypothetical protein
LKKKGRKTRQIEKQHQKYTTTNTEENIQSSKYKIQKNTHTHNKYSRADKTINLLIFIPTENFLSIIHTLPHAPNL